MHSFTIFPDNDYLIHVKHDKMVTKQLFYVKFYAFNWEGEWNTKNYKWNQFTGWILIKANKYMEDRYF